MSRWRDAAGHTTGADYHARFEALAATGADVHGEADLVQRLAPPGGRILDAGCGTGRVAIELAARGFRVVGADLDPSMLAVARRRAPGLPWIEADLATLDLTAVDLTAVDPATVDVTAVDVVSPGPEPRVDRAIGDAPTHFDLVVAAGNVIPLLAAGTEPAVIAAMARHLGADGLLVTGFGLDPAHLPLDHAPVTLDDLDAWCAAADLELDQRLATWDGDPWDDGGYAVSIHRRA